MSDGEDNGASSVAPSSRIDDILQGYASALRGSYLAYRNHAQRVALICESLIELDEAEREQMHIAAAFHDLGIWTHETYDYIDPSLELAREYVERNGHGAWGASISALIADHHTLRRPRHALAALSNAFRKADVIDIACAHQLVFRDEPLSGLMRVFPGAGFHRLLLKLTARQLLRTPWNPVPAIRFEAPRYPSSSGDGPSR